MVESYKENEDGHKKAQPHPQASATPAAPAAPWVSWEFGVALLLFGVPMWIAGARFTFDGARIGLNYLLARMTIPAQIPALDWRVMIAVILLIGWVCSRVEVHAFPIRRARGRLLFVGGTAIVGWMLTSATDLATTVISVANPRADAWPLTRWVAQTVPALAVWSIWLTFVPEWMIIAGWRIVRGRRK